MQEKKTVSLEIKKINRSSVYQLLRQQSDLTRQDIAMQLRLSLPTVTQNLNELQSEGLIMESGSIGNTGGRRARSYSVVKDARLAIGIDITRNHITAVAVDLAGAVIKRVRIRYSFSQSEAYYRKLGELVNTVIKDTKLDTQKILGVGISVPGLITKDNQTVFYGKILDFTGATCSEFSQFIPFSTAFFNDANAACFAEIWANSSVENAFYLMLSNNIGGSVLINNRIYPGESLRSSEVGHITIVPNGKPCYCGQRGCVDTYCAATVLSSIADNDLDNFFSLLKNGDLKAKSVWDEYLYHLSITVNNLRMLFDCSVILGGYVGEYMDEYMDDLKQLAAARNTFEENADYLKACLYKTESLAAGAALNFISSFINTI